MGPAIHCGGSSSFPVMARSHSWHSKRSRAVTPSTRWHSCRRWFLDAVLMNLRNSIPLFSRTGASFVRSMRMRCRPGSSHARIGLPVYRMRSGESPMKWRFISAPVTSPSTLQVVKSTVSPAGHAQGSSSSSTFTSPTSRHNTHVVNRVFLSVVRARRRLQYRRFVRQTNHPNT